MTEPPPSRLTLYGWLGIALMLSTVICVLAGLQWFAIWFTPLMWTGYILLVDAIVLARTGTSRITRDSRTFVLMLLLSALCWLLFEIYNLRLKNWYYVNLPANLLIRDLGYFWAFATIFPGIFESYDLLDTLGLFKGQTGRKTTRWTDFWLTLSIMFGLAYVIIPPMLPPVPARYTFGFVWLGYFFLFDPINYRLDLPSVLHEWEQGNHRTLYLLLAAGALCGLLWESWNFFTLQFGGAAWIYKLPPPLNVLEHIFRIGRMPLLGFLGFPPFALECYALWHFLKHILVPDNWNANSL